jgi:uncharacterized protein YjbJ (UPF0337 family)
MSKLTDEVAGKTKEIVAEVTGDEKLQKDGEKQRKKPDPSDPLETPKNLGVKRVTLQPGGDSNGIHIPSATPGNRQSHA